jgi:hypothetical protein
MPIDERIEDSHAAISLLDKIRPCVMKRLPRNAATPLTHRYVMHRLHIANNVIAIADEVFPDLFCRAIDRIYATSLPPGWTHTQSSA